MILDASGLLVFLDAHAHQHKHVDWLIETATEPLLSSPFILAEVDYLVTTRLGPGHSLRFLEDVAAGAYKLEPMNSHDVGAALAIMQRYGSLTIGLADASIVVLAERHGVGDVLTFDQRHFRAITWGNSKPFRLLPTDA